MTNTGGTESEGGHAEDRASLRQENATLSERAPFSAPPVMILRVLLRISQTLGCLLALAGSVWSVGAIYFDFPWPSWRGAGSAALALVLVAAVTLVPSQRRKFAVVAGCCLLVMSWWLTLKPSNDRHWKPDVARTAWTEIDGDSVTIHGVRNCDYRSETDFTPNWETRAVRLSEITGVDLVTIYWGSPWIAHIIVSFQFADTPPLSFSIETRMEVGETYSALAGFYRHYELIYVAAEERDVIRLRTNYRPGADGRGEDAYLYHLTASPELARIHFLEYLATINSLHARPRWYNAVTANCLTSIRAQSEPAHRSRWDWRLLLNGDFDRLLYERGDLVTHGSTFAELKKRSLINPAARAAGDAEDFSTLIRAGR